MSEHREYKEFIAKAKKTTSNFMGFVVTLIEGFAEVNKKKEALSRQRDQLLAACKELTDALNNCPGSFNYDPKIEDRAKAAIEQAEK